MCGIIGYIGNRDSQKVLVEALKSMEYRGYDSAGVFDGKDVFKAVGRISNLESKLSGDGSTIGIGHTRWATHGGVEERNAHPHSDCSSKIFAVHNGIIDNFQQLRERMKGHTFVSDTDSEIIPHFFEDGITHERIQEFMKIVRGEFAIVMTDGERLYAMRRKSPLAIGIGDGEFFVASDIFAFNKYANRAIFLDDDEYAIITRKGVEVFSSDGTPLTKQEKQIPDIPEPPEGLTGDHYMIAEIREQPTALRRLFSNIEADSSYRKFVEDVQSNDTIYPIGAGTSYHAGYFFSLLLQKLGKHSFPILASEFMSYNMNGFVVAISQSGETMDLIRALDGREFAGVVNVPFSTIQRMSKYSVNILAGKETAVASTKAFINQIGLFSKIYSDISGDSFDVMRPVERALEMEGIAKQWAEQMKSARAIYVIGSGLNVPISKEIALKIKEITYIPTLSLASGELKHGTLSLIEDGVPVIVVSDSEQDEIACHEISARGGKVFNISHEMSGFSGIPHSFFSAVLGQLVAYHIAKLLGRDIDKPRNLAKSVTVR